MKRLLAKKIWIGLRILCLALCMLMGITSKTYAAEEDMGNKYSNLKWYVEGNTLIITGEGPMQVQQSADKYPWKSYGSKIQKIVLGDEVITIAQSAFGNMTGLQEVVLGKKLAVIEESAFSGCANLSQVKLAEKPNLVTLMESAFSGCKALKEMNLSTVRVIEDGVFEDCTALQKVTMGTNSIEIGERAFRNCKLLGEINLTYAVKTIGEKAFEGCESLKKATLGAYVGEIESYAFYGCKALEEINISNKVTSIKAYTFYGCKSLKKVTMGTGLTYIGECAFWNCKALAEINIPGGVTDIRDGAFGCCEALVDVTIPNGVTTIGFKAFYKCGSLKKVTLGTGVKEIGLYAFSECKALEEITIPGGVTRISSDAFQSCESLRNVTLGIGLKEIGACAFAGCKVLEELTIPNGVTFIDMKAFQGCESLRKVTLGTGITEINDYTFAKCSALEEIIIPDNVTKILYRAFWDCNGLKKVSVGSNVTEIGNWAFESCDLLTNFKITAKNTVYANNVFYQSPVTLYGLTGSTTQSYASANNLSFVAIDKIEAPKITKCINVVSGPHIYWNEVANATHYALYRAVIVEGDNSLSFVRIEDGLTETHYIDNGVASGTTCCYRVIAVNAYTRSEESAKQYITYVGTPDITTRVNKAAGINLGWNKITGATGYAIYRKSYAGNDAWKRVGTISGNSTFSWTDESVKTKNGEAYRYTIRALAEKDMSTLSGCRTNGRTMVRLTSRELNSAEKASANSIRCSWTTSSLVNGYEVRFMDGNKVVKTETIDNYKTGVKTFSGLPAGKKYKVQVRSYKKLEGVGSFYSAWSVAKYVQL